MCYLTQLVHDSLQCGEFDYGLINSIGDILPNNERGLFKKDLTVSSL